mmetsp:Transcript_17196/g.49751  ORF Transcript_17196/g.49751 Transcript_17196/m.49751 type:complete len:212 (+) Transcript_17196:1789-2424(+)
MALEQIGHDRGEVRRLLAFVPLLLLAALALLSAPTLRQRRRSVELWRRCRRRRRSGRRRHSGPRLPSGARRGGRGVPCWRTGVRRWRRRGLSRREPDLAHVRDALGRLAELHKLRGSRSGSALRRDWVGVAAGSSRVPRICRPIRSACARGASAASERSAGAKVDPETGVQLVGDLPSQLFVHVIQHASEELLRILLGVPLEHGVQLLDRP